MEATSSATWLCASNQVFALRLGLKLSLTFFAFRVALRLHGQGHERAEKKRPSAFLFLPRFIFFRVVLGVEFPGGR